MAETVRALRDENRRLQAEIDELQRRLGTPPSQTCRLVEEEVWEAWVEAEQRLEGLLCADSTETVETAGPDPAADDDLDGPTVESALKESRRRLLRIADALQERDERVRRLQGQKDELLGIVAHDLRTPLVAIQGFAQLLQGSHGERPLAEKQLEYLERIRMAAGAMNRLVEDLLTARRLEKGRLPLRPRGVNVNEFVEGLMELCGEGARQRELNLVLDLPETPLRSLFDPDRVAQALSNLLENAIRCTRRRTTVTVRVRLRGRRLRFEVLDQGPGVDEDLLPGIFDRYAQGRAELASGRGSGLGLHICREIAAYHGGTAGAENLDEGGSRFWFEIAYTPGPDEREEAEELS